MSGSKIIAVVGGTGTQGGGLVRAILANPDAGMRARVLTRKVEGEAAKALAAQGAEVAFADLDDPGSLARAFEGAHGAYCVTNFWEHFSPQREVAQAKAMAQAAATAGLQHVVWSTLEDTRRFMAIDDPRMPTLMEHYKVPHFDAKGEADDEFRRAGVPTTFMLTSFYWENFLTMMPPRRGEDGELAIVLPMADARLPGIATEDIGRCAFGLFRGGQRWIGQTVGVCGGQPTGDEMAATLGEALGQKVRYQAVPAAVYRGFGFPGADDIGNMFQFKQEFNAAFCGARSVATSRELDPQLQDFAGWAKANAARIQIG